MALTDQQLLDEIQRAMIEPPDLGATWPSGLWSLAEILNYLNQRQQRYLEQTYVTGGWADQAMIANQPIHVLPQAWMATLHVIVETDGRALPVYPQSRTEADLHDQLWAQTMDRPYGYVELQTGTLSWMLVPPPLVGGILHLFGIWLAEICDRTGINFAVPDELVPYLYYGTLADMFGKQGRAFDEPRRRYCEERFEEGIAVGRAMVEAVTMP